MLAKAVPYVESLTLSYRQSVFSFEFAALSYANSHKNRYRYKLEGFDPDWSEVDSKQRLATYTNLDHGDYVFRVQGSNSDGVWNEEGVSLPILITPPWYRTSVFRAAAGGLFLALLWAAYQVRMRQVQHAFEMTLDARVGERTRIARELHDTLLQSFHGLLLRFQTVSYLLTGAPGRSESSNWIARLSRRRRRSPKAGTPCRACGRRPSNATISRWQSGPLATSSRPTRAPTRLLHSASPSRDTPRDLHPILRDEIYKIAAEALRNAFRHAQAGRVEVEIRYDSENSDCGCGTTARASIRRCSPAQGIEGHYGLRGMPERAALIGGKLAVWSEVGAGTEVELRLPAAPSTRHPRGAPGGRGCWHGKTPANDEETRHDRQLRRFGFSPSTTIHWCAKGSPVSWESSRI